MTRTGPGPRERHPLCKLEIQGPSSRAATAGRAGIAAPSTACSSCFSCDSGALEKEFQNEPWDCTDCSSRLHCLVTWTLQLHCTGNYSPQNSTTLLKVATKRSPPSDLSWNAGWDADSFEMVSRNSKFIETVNFVLNIDFSNHGQHRKTVHWNAHTGKAEKTVTAKEPAVYLVLQECQSNVKQIALCLKAFFCSSCLQFSNGKYGRKDEWFMNAHCKKSNNILKQCFIAWGNGVKQTTFMVIFIERKCIDFWQGKKFKMKRMVLNVVKPLFIWPKAKDKTHSVRDLKSKKMKPIAF